MEQVRLGRSGLKVSRLALGCMSFGVSQKVIPNSTACRKNGCADHTPRSF